MELNDTQVATLRNAALFTADKLRKAGDILNRFRGDPTLEGALAIVRGREAACRNLAEVADAAPDEMRDLAGVVLVAHADDLNRKAQLMSDRYNTEAATAYGDRLIEAYATLDAVHDSAMHPESQRAIE